MNTPIGWLKSELDRHPIDDLRDLRIMRPPYTPRRESRLARLTGYVKRRWHYAGIGGALAILATVLGGTADSLGSPWRDLNLNLAADLLGTMLALFLIGPMIERGDMRREKVIDRFDHRTFLRQIEQCKRNIAILELWTDLLEGVYERHFRDGLNVALDNGAEVQILIMDPDTPAAQQRAHELSRNDVPARIMRNLVVLHEMRNRLESQRRKRLNVRVYSILPSVQLYQVDDHILASFFPATVPSWESTQHQTRPHYGLGKFLTGHFNELWDGVKTQTLDDYRHLTLERCDPSSERGTARFVIVDEACYVGESDWLRQHISNQGTHGLLLMIIHIYVGDEHSRGPCRLQPIQPGASDHALVHQRFRLKYGEEFLSGIFKIIEE